MSYELGVPNALAFKPPGFLAFQLHPLCPLLPALCFRFRLPHSNFRIQASALTKLSTVPHPQRYILGIEIFDQRNDKFAGNPGHLFKLGRGNITIGFKEFNQFGF
jgi:hypothetical protein